MTDVVGRKENEMSNPNRPLDQMCHELAEQFLRGCKGATDEDVEVLAEEIQTVCEDHAGVIAAYGQEAEAPP